MYTLLIFINFLIFIVSILPNWNLKKCAKDLLDINTNTNTYTYRVTHRLMYKLVAELNKTITRGSDNTITYENKLFINGTNKGTVQFEQIESFYHTDSNYDILCPIGNYDPINLNGMTIIQNSYHNNENWDLKCYNHNSGDKYFFTFYFMNGGNQVYDLENANTYKEYSALKIQSELYDFKLANREGETDSNSYPICALIKYENKIQFVGTEYGLKLRSNIWRNQDKYKSLTDAKEYSQGYFNNYTNDFYYITYNSISDFISGYSTKTVEGSNYYTNDVEVTNNEKSPFEFINNVEIEEMKFLLYTHYVYYTIKDNTEIDKKFHGILNVKTNKIMFNTDEKINTFIPYSNYSMLVITDESAYELCIIQDDNGKCLEQCSSENLLLTVDGNICSSGSSCGEGKYMLKPEGVCISECNTSIYIKIGTDCGLCRDIGSGQYKILDSTECLEQVPDTAEISDPALYLLKCKSGYALNPENNTCEPHCYATCKTCSDYSTDYNEQKCSDCIDGYYLEDGTTNCKKNEVECREDIKEKCAKCSEESNEIGYCISCKEGYKKVNYTILYPQFLDCLKEDDPIIKKKFFFEEESGEYRPCYKTCKKCLKEGDASNNNCLECETGYMLRPGNNTYNNCVVYSEFYYITSYNQYKTLDIYQCPEESKYYILDKKSCIDDCKKDSEYQFLYNGNCIKECPSDTTIENNVCKVPADKCTKGENTLNLKNNELDVVETLVKTYISEFSYTDLHISIYKNENYSVMIYKKSYCITELNLEMPNIDFQQCYNKVKKAYNISADQDLIISIVEKTLQGLNPITFFSFFHPLSGQKLDADEICKDDTIIVEENLNELLNKNNTYYSAMTSLTDQGINIFDLNDPFFIDLCYDFDNPLKKDVPLNDRVTYFYPNVELCDDGCQIQAINIEDMSVKCDCKFNDITNNALLKDNALMDTMAGQIFDLINSSNLLVFKCIKYMFTHFSTSIGGWLSLILILAHIGMILLYFLIELNKMKIFLYSFTNRYIAHLPKNTKSNSNAPPKKVSFNANTKPNIREKNNVIIFEKKEFDLKSDKIKLKNSKLDTKIKDNKRLISFGNSIDVHLISNANNNKTDATMNKDDKDFFKEYLKTSPDDMEFDDALYYDKRTFKELLLESLKEDQIIAHTFIADDPLKPRTIKIIVFILNVILYFVVNGLVFSEEVIGELFEVNEDDENFFSYFPRSIERIVYSTLVSIVIGIITDLFFFSEDKIKKIYKSERNQPKACREKIVHLINDIKKRNIAFIVIASIILIFSFFYLLCFNYVYPYSQIEWIKSSITIVIIMQLLSVIKCLLQSGLRKLSFKIRSEKMYKIGKLLD